MSVKFSKKVGKIKKLRPQKRLLLAPYESIKDLHAAIDYHAASATKWREEHEKLFNKVYFPENRQQKLFW